MTDPAKKLTRAVIVAAVSTPEQAADEKESLDAQERDARAYCEANGFAVVDVIRIEGFSRSYFTLRELVTAADKKGEHGPRRLEEHIAKADFDVMVVRATNRFNREQSLNAEIIGKTIQLCNAEIHSSLDGRIDRQNYRAMTAITGYRDGMEVDELKKRRVIGMRGRLARGQKVSSIIPFGFMEVSDPRYKKPVLTPDPQYRRLWDDLETLLLEGVPYHKLERELEGRFGHPHYPSLKFRALMMTAVFWGHNAQHYQSETYANGHRSGAWIYDPSLPVPDEVEIRRDTHAPIYGGEQARRVIAELNRRHELRGSTRPHNTAEFSGLLVCKECGYYLVRVSNGGYRAWMCNTRFHQRQRRRTCTTTRQINEKKVRAHFHQVIEIALATNSLEGFAPHPERDLEDRQRQLQAELDADAKAMRSLMDAIRTVDTSNPAWQMYTVEVAALGNAMKVKERALFDTRSQIMAYDSADQYRALEDIRAVTLERFWDLPSRTINQLLHRLLGSYCLAMVAGELKHIVLAPKGRRSA